MTAKNVAHLQGHVTVPQPVSDVCPKKRLQQFSYQVLEVIPVLVFVSDRPKTRRLVEQGSWTSCKPQSM